MLCETKKGNDKGGASVTLLSYTPEPEKVVAAAAKLCYSNSEIQDLYEG